MRVAVPWTLFAASLVVNVVFLSGVLTSGGRELVRQTALELPPEDVAEPLALDDTQQAALAALRDEANERGTTLREASNGLRQDLLSLLAAADFDKAAFAESLQRASAQREAQFIELAGLLHSYLQELTPAQRADLLDRAQERGFLKALLFGGAKGEEGSGAEPQKSSN